VIATMTTTTTTAVIQQRPFHLSYYEEDLVYFIREQSLLDTEEVSRSCTTPPSDFFLAKEVVLATDEPAKEVVFATDEPAKEVVFATDEPAKEVVLATDEPGRVYVRVFYRPSSMTYSVSMTYTPWPAFSEDPFRTHDGYPTLREALAQVHRTYRYYRHDTRRPVPFYENYVDHRLTADAMNRLEEEATRGLGLLP
jgi:hypothetical protein